MLGLELAVGIGERGVPLEERRMDDGLFGGVVVVDRPLVPGVPGGQRRQPLGVGGPRRGDDGLGALGVDAHRSVFEVAGAQIRLEVD
jgi:hypothetical protein